MSQLESIFRTVAWAAGYTALGLTVGTFIDGIVGNRISSLTKFPLISGFGQFVIGAALLSEIVIVVVPEGTVSPVGDGLLFYWFFEAQPIMRENLASAALMFRSMLFGTGRRPPPNSNPPPGASGSGGSTAGSSGSSSDDGTSASVTPSSKGNPHLHAGGHSHSHAGGHSHVHAGGDPHTNPGGHPHQHLGGHSHQGYGRLADG